jgi:hypothetical protein
VQNTTPKTGMSNVKGQMSNQCPMFNDQRGRNPDDSRCQIADGKCQIGPGIPNRYQRQNRNPGTAECGNPACIQTSNELLAARIPGLIWSLTLRLPRCILCKEVRKEDYAR